MHSCAVLFVPRLFAACLHLNSFMHLKDSHTYLYSFIAGTYISHFIFIRLIFTVLLHNLHKDKRFPFNKNAKFIANAISNECEKSDGPFLYNTIMSNCFSLRAPHQSKLQTISTSFTKNKRKLQLERRFLFAIFKLEKTFLFYRA